MATETITVSTGNDDGQETAAGNVSLTGVATTIGSGGTPMTFGFIIRGVNADHGDTINDARVNVYPVDDTLDSPNLTIRAERNPANFSTADFNMTSRTRTTATVTWNATDIGINAYKTSPDIATVIQEIIDDPGWVSGGDIAIFMLNVGGALRVRSYNGSPTQAPQLYIDWSPPAAAGSLLLPRRNRTYVRM